MKIANYLLIFTFCSMGFAAPQTSLICRNDQRMNGGALSEVILSSTAEGYQIKSLFSPSLHSPELKVESWGEKLNCRFDPRAKLAYCENSDQQNVVMVKKQQVTFYDSLKEDEKRKTKKDIVITVKNDGVETNAISFAASHCQTFGGEA